MSITMTRGDTYPFKFQRLDAAIAKDGKVGEGIKFERIRRITGYLAGTLDRFNDGKRAEVKDRVRHL